MPFHQILGLLKMQPGGRPNLRVNGRSPLVPTVLFTTGSFAGLHWTTNGPRTVNPRITHGSLAWLCVEAASGILPDSAQGLRARPSLMPIPWDPTCTHSTSVRPIRDPRSPSALISASWPTLACMCLFMRAQQSSWVSPRRGRVCFLIRRGRVIMAPPSGPFTGHASPPVSVPLASLFYHDGASHISHRVSISPCCCPTPPRGSRCPPWAAKQSGYRRAHPQC